VNLRPLAMAMVHYPVLDRRGDVVSAAVTNLDIHDLARLAATYGLARFYLVVPVPEQQILVERIVAHWCKGFGANYNSDRRTALDTLEIVSDIEGAETNWRSLAGSDSLTVLTGARHSDGLDFASARQLGVEHPLLLVFGTGHGLADALYSPSRLRLSALRAGQYNHLSVRTAAAIIVDRLIGETGVVMLPEVS
jgi:hypothetical protein